MKVYICGPMTGIPEHNFPAFNDAARALRTLGFSPVNPADNGVMDGWAWADYLKLDIPLLVRCAAVALLDGWENSRGANLEVYIAEALGIPCHPLAELVRVRQDA